MFEELPSLCPIQFFGIGADCRFLVKGTSCSDKQYLLPSTAHLLDQELFADVYAAWSFEKLSFFIDAHIPFSQVSADDIRKGDSVELFIDTRDLKSRGIVSRFCHHFVFYPIILQGFYGRETTRFRNEEGHRLCHPEDLTVVPQVAKNSYSLNIEIPASCLTGFDPMSFPRFGFTYRINRAGSLSQNFAVSSEECVIEQHPASWGTLQLVET